ncbi:AMP-dependent synthetase/ligase [Anoxybacillus flavithermus TNO-09.006]|uniref:long-chain-fatty-acid--CoA ligase n=1 Tax=Anoxybacillus flavithermus TaxID=33934 RepID=UPI0002A7358F|nr:long-chain-fatty-acid--CoA ligase [Anoxybacillus flavithermus]ELK22777.1 AMP-dependent synthetase/ligase [Anoxybacillus flavithermus TNO-09.006]MBE2908433.1 long-chain-fatty-acid--CoA ligase [Anoxybacillus flavithermus]MBE2911228.1 long-chain-fatty-acid--CoA ligase [Anoxybacillus flavithermus]MBE2916470.1 long-chain-fatty-acid--CoA ligase [Anoxybacillus flavithermus]MBE2924813.1 long-chain-fatty-acid--CoA ligase [Anoxybacillus flavithermus]
MEKPWLALYPQQVPHSIDYPRKPLQQFLQEAAEQFPQKTAIHFLGKELTYKEIYEQAIKLASYLQQLGLQKGDRVSIMLPNCPQAVISYYAVLFAGGIVVQTNPLYTERELEYQLNDSGAKVIIALDLLYPRITKVKAHTKIEHVIITSIKDYLPFPKNVLYPFVQKKQTGMIVRVKHEGDCHLFTKALSLASGKVKETDVDPIEDIALLQYTGGTTGFPKAAMLTHYNLTANTFMCAKWMYKCERGNESILGVLPFFHVYGMTAVMNLSIMEGYKMILLPKFDVETTLKTIEKQRPTLFPGAPTIYIALLNHPNLKKYDLSSIKICISGSAPLPVEVQEQFETVTGGKVVEGYGLTEASPVTHSNFIWDGKRIKGSIGVPWPDTEAMIVSLETGEKANVNEIGEIVVRGPQVMKGYWNRPEETAATLRDGWLYTGDLGYMNEEGYFFVVDRKKDMIIASGYNVYPREVEEVLYEHPKVQEAVVIGVPDAYRGETVKAFIVLKEGEQCTEEELDQFMRSKLAAYKVPRIYEFRKELPKTAVGKILRRALVEEEKEKQK